VLIRFFLCSFIEFSSDKNTASPTKISPIAAHSCLLIRDVRNTEDKTQGSCRRKANVRLRGGSVGLLFLFAFANVQL
jgi:hypothetical protein